LAPWRIATWRAASSVTTECGSRSIPCSADATSAGESIVNTRESPSPARTASLTTRPSAESPLVAVKSAMTILLFAASSPLAMSDPNGPTPSARMPMNAAIIATNAPSAYIPPRAARYQLTCGAAFRAIVAIVPCTTLGVPPGVNVGVAVAARRTTRCTYPVHRTTGRPSAMTTREPGKTQSGRPIPTIAALATIATTTNAAA
jgi:hypothetical protein